MKTYGIILASGTGKRFGSDIPKQFLKINGRTILEYSVDVFETASCVDEVIVVITPEYKTLAEDIIVKNNYKKVSKILCGGKERKGSSFIGINSLNEVEAKVLIHDCARPLVSAKIIADCVNGLEKFDAVCVAIPMTDTILETQNGSIKNIPDRKKFMRVQTPQGFKLSVIKKAHELSKNDENFTDDCGLVVKYKLCKVGIVEGSEDNLKITYPNDLYLAEKILSE